MTTEPTNAASFPLRGPVREAEQIMRLPRGYPLPEGWYFKRLIYETTDLYGTWDVILMGQIREVEDDPDPDTSPFESPSFETVEKGIDWIDRWHERREKRKERRAS